MANKAEAPRVYSAAYQHYHASRPGFHINEIHLSPSQTIPWHLHSNVQDTFFVLEGRVHIFLKEPMDEVKLEPGEVYTVVARRPHLVVNDGGARASFLVLQGFGEYDFIPLAADGNGRLG